MVLWQKSIITTYKKAQKIIGITVYSLGLQTIITLNDVFRRKCRKICDVFDEISSNYSYFMTNNTPKGESAHIQTPLGVKY